MASQTAIKMMRQNNTARGIPGVNEKRILELYEGDFTIYLPVLRAYVDELPGALSRLRNVSAVTLPNYARAMHGIKGTSASACVDEAEEMAAVLVKMAKAGDLTGVLARNKGFLLYMDNLVRDIQNWLDKSS